MGLFSCQIKFLIFFNKNHLRMVFLLSLLKIIYMKKILLSLFIFCTINLNAQEFKPFGVPEALIYTNFSNSGGLSKFEITRAYFGYDYNFSTLFTGRLVFDFVTPGNVFIKYGYMQYEKNGLNIRSGLVPNVQKNATICY